MPRSLSTLVNNLSQDLWHAHYQVLSIIFLKELMELNVNLDMMIKNAKLPELNTSIATLEYINSKDHLIEYKSLCCNKNYQRKFDEKLKELFLMHTDFLITTTISLFYYCGKVFILMNILMIGENLMKY